LQSPFSDVHTAVYVKKRETTRSWVIKFRTVMLLLPTKFESHEAEHWIANSFWPYNTSMGRTPNPTNASIPVLAETCSKEQGKLFQCPLEWTK
jgi:hypothetical protein